MSISMPATAIKKAREHELGSQDSDQDPVTGRLLRRACLFPATRSKASTTDLWVMSLVGNCKCNYVAAQMTTHGAARMLVIDSIVTHV